jgi:hypothetical protein
MHDNTFIFYYFWTDLSELFIHVQHLCSGPKSHVEHDDTTIESLIPQSNACQVSNHVRSTMVSHLILYQNINIIESDGSDLFPDPSAYLVRNTNL